MTLSVGSLFTGVGGFDQGFLAAGCRIAWMSEIDPLACAVLRRHFPLTPLLGDVRELRGGELKPVDVIIAGFPCQDLSVAGNRAGLAGDRSGLFFEFARVVRELRPAYVVWENVPGLLSSGKGQDLEVILNTFAELGYVCDLNILDARYFGVPQRRRRLFGVCVRLDALLQKKTKSSELTCLDLTAQLLLACWDALLEALSHAQLPSGFERRVGASRDLPHKRMQSFERLLGASPLPTLLANLAAGTPAPSLSDCRASDSIVPSCESPVGTSTPEGIASPQQSMAKDAGFGSTTILRRLSRRSAALYARARSSITSTSINSITSRRMYTCVGTMLNILDYMRHSTESWETSFDAASSCLTLTQEITAYARQAASDLFGESTLRSDWWNYISAASDLADDFEQCVGIRSPAAVLFEPTGVRRHSSARGEAWQDATIGAEDRPGSAGSDVAGTLGSRPVGGRGGWNSDTDRMTFVPEVLPEIVAIQDGGRGAEKQQNGLGVSTGPMYTLDATSQHAIAFTERTRADGPSLDYQEDLAYALTNPGEGGRTQNRMVAVPDVVGTLATNTGPNGHDAGNFACNQAVDAGHLIPDVAPTLQASLGHHGRSSPRGDGCDALIPDLAPTLGTNDSYDCGDSGDPLVPDTIPSVTSHYGKGGEPDGPANALNARNNRYDGESQSFVVAPAHLVVRRLTPREAERLQGFEDDWTKWDDKGKEIADTHRYKMLGNAVCTNVAEWIARRLVAEHTRSVTQLER